MDTTQIIIVVINAILVPLLMWGLAELSLFIRAKSAAIKDDAIRANIDSLMHEASQNVRTAINETAQTYVDALKKAGTFDAEAQKVAFEKSYARFETLMGDAGMAALEDVVSDVNAWITAKIESTVKSGF